MKSYIPCNSKSISITTDVSSSMLPLPIIKVPIHRSVMYAWDRNAIELAIKFFPDDPCVIICENGNFSKPHPIVNGVITEIEG